MIIIAPFAQKLRSGGNNPKNWPVKYWKQLIGILTIKHIVVQVGLAGEEQLVPDFRKNLSIPDLRKLIRQCDTWIGVDSFFQHIAWDEGKTGVAIFSQSDPIIFGHPENTNLLKSRKYLRENQFLTWEQAAYLEEAFVGVSEVMDALEALALESV